MIDRTDDLPVSRQAKALGISRGSVYYLPRPVSAEDLSIMRRIDELHLESPFAGSRMLQGFLVREGYRIGRRHVVTLMKRMGIEALYRRPNTSKPAPGHTIFPYLLRKLTVTRPNQVWATDITYIPMARGFVYLAAVVDWFSRKVLAWRVSITLDAAFCIEAVEEAIARYGRPEIFNTDQGSQFTSTAFTGLLMKNQIKISMDGKGAWRDNVFVERLWRTIKYEEVYLRAYASVPEARASIGRYIDGFYNVRRPHSSLDRQTPDEAYFNCAAANPGCSITEAEIHLTEATSLFKQTEPPLVETFYRFHLNPEFSLSRRTCSISRARRSTRPWTASGLPACERGSLSELLRLSGCRIRVEKAAPIGQTRSWHERGGLMWFPLCR